MKKLSLNQDWLFASGTITMMELFMGSDGKIQTVDLPHDAMIYQERREDTANAHQTGFYPGGEYTYIKQWEVPEELEGQTVILEFEGVADACRIYFNGVLKAVNSNPYREIFVDVSDDLNCGTVNEIKVEVRSVEQSSRWYSGAGLYRPVSAWTGEEVHIPVDGVKITTAEVTGIWPGTADRIPASVEDRYVMGDETDVSDRDMTAVVEVSVPICNRARARRSMQLRVALCEGVCVSQSGDVSCGADVMDGREVTAECLPVTVPGDSTVRQVVRLTVDQPLLWSDETPNLYTCRVEIVEVAGAAPAEENPATKSSTTMEDTCAKADMIDSNWRVVDSVSIPVGIRVLGLSAKQGLTINGKSVKLRGSCIHHDNGILGAATFADAEYRRCRQLKEAGFNALRSAHHPMSKAMLDACDRLGMLVLDELSDMWTRTKNPHDYANYFSVNWEQDVENMIAKDYNHPSVILYSTGNEIPEAGTAYGADWNRRINAKMKQLDPTRYTTSGINGLMAASDRMGEIMCQATGMSPEQLADMMGPEQENGSAGVEQGGVEAAGADAVNGMAAVLVGPLADAIATSPIMEETIGEFAGVNDIAGYNYLTALHEEDHRRHPNRVVLGTETFPSDIVHLWDVVRRNPHVLGDFTWTGYDYLGEAGCGIFHYDGAANFAAHWPDRLAGIGDIDILGDRKPISYLRQAVYGIGTAPSIGVMRMDKDPAKASKTPWMWKDNIASWTWNGYEGKTASIDVYANADEVELLLNGESLGKKSVSGTYLATWEVPYAPGTLEAVSYIDQKEAGRCVLKTAGTATQFLVEVETGRKKCCETEKSNAACVALPVDGESLVYVKIRLADAESNWNRQEEKNVTIKVEGNAVLQGYGSANPSCMGSYAPRNIIRPDSDNNEVCAQNGTWETYDGAVMAVIRAGKIPGETKITITADGCAEESLVITASAAFDRGTALASRHISS